MQAGVTNRLDVDRKMLDCARDRPRSSTLPLPLLLLLGLPIPHPHCDADATVVADIIDVCGCMASGCLCPHQVPRGQKECTVAVPPTLHSPFPPWQPASRSCRLVQPCTRRRCHGRRRGAWRWRRCRWGSSRRRNCTLPHHFHRPPAVFRATDARHAGHEATGERLARRAGLVWVIRGWCADRGRGHVESQRQVGLLGRVPTATRRELD